MNLNCRHLGFGAKRLLVESRLVFDVPKPAPEGVPAVIEPAKTPETVAADAKNGIENGVVAPLRAEAGKKLDDLAVKKAKEDKVLAHVKETETKANTENPDLPAQQEVAQFKFTDINKMIFIGVLRSLDKEGAPLLKELITRNGDLDYTVFEEDGEGAKVLGFYWGDGAWKISTSWHKKDIKIGSSFSEAANNILNKREYRALINQDVVNALAAAHTNYQVLTANSDADLSLQDPATGERLYGSLVASSQGIIEHVKSQTGWQRIKDVEVLKTIWQCGVGALNGAQNGSQNDDYMYMFAGNKIFRKSLKGNEIAVMDVLEPAAMVPHKPGTQLAIKHFKGLFHESNFKTATPEDVDKAVRVDVNANAARYAAVTGEAPQPAAPGPDGAKIETPALSPELEKFKVGLFPQGLSVTVAASAGAAVISSAFTEKIEARYVTKYNKKDPNTDKLSPANELALKEKDNVVGSIVTGLMKQYEDWNKANPKTEDAAKLSLKIDPQYALTLEWADSRGAAVKKKVAETGKAGVDAAKNAAEKAKEAQAIQQANAFLQSKVGKFMLGVGSFLGPLLGIEGFDKKALIEHFSGRKKMKNMGMLTMLAGVGGNSKQIDKLAEKQPWLAKIRTGFDKLIDKVSAMVGIEPDDEVAKTFVAELRTLGGSGPLQNPIVLETQMGDSFDGMVIAAQGIDFPVGRNAKFRKIGETAWQEGQLANANGYEVMVSQALDGVTIPQGATISVDSQMTVKTDAPAAPKSSPAPSDTVKPPVTTTEAPKSASTTDTAAAPPEAPTDKIT